MPRVTLVIFLALLIVALPVIAVLASERFAKRPFAPSPGVAVVLALGGLALLLYPSR